MKKLITKCLLIIAVIISSTIVSTFKITADDSHTHFTSGMMFTFTEWNSTTSLPEGFGCYYLAEDITLSNDVTIDETLYICLNGHVINLNGHHIVVIDEKRLGIFDCQETEHEGYVDANNQWHLAAIGHPAANETSKTINGGIITGGNATNGGCIEIKSGSIGGQVYLINGTIAGNLSSENGGAIYNNGYFEMQGGSIVNNVASLNGGAIYNEKTVNIGSNSKEVSENYSGTNGGAIYNGNNGNLSIQSLKMKNNKALVNGGAIYNMNYAELLSGTLETNKAKNGGAVYSCSGARTEISSSTITGCSAEEKGGAIYNNVHSGDDLKTVVIGENTSISNCEAVENGGAIYNLGTIGLEKVSISNNKATSASSNGGGIYQGGALFVGGTLKVNENTANSITNNVYLPDGSFMTIGSGLDVKVPAEGMHVGVTMENPSIFTANVAGDYKNFFSSDDAAYRVKYTADNKLQLVSSIIVTNIDKSGNYTSLVDAIADVENGQTLRLLDDNSENVEVSREITFIIDEYTSNNNATITAGSGYALSISGVGIVTYKITLKPQINDFVIPNTGIK